jgi:hypothetical protein
VAVAVEMAMDTMAFQALPSTNNPQTSAKQVLLLLRPNLSAKLIILKN